MFLIFVCSFQMRATTGHGDLSVTAPMPKPKAAQKIKPKTW